MENKTDNKLARLDSILKEMGSVVVAFSGGVDSTFLLHRISGTEGLRYTALTIRTSYIPSREIEEASEFCMQHSINHHILDVNFPEIIRDNPPERCYLCKKMLFSIIIDFAKDNGYRFIADGTNFDDRGEHRPGLNALREMGIRSPLLESELTKKEIREESRKANLNTWDKPAYACLLTRIPHNTFVTEKDLRMIEEAEHYLFGMGLAGTRVRLHGETARIECMPAYLSRFVNDPERDQIIRYFKKIGFRFITLDLEGYRTGSMNPLIEDYQ